ncbi:TPA: hypothetical protein N2B89_005898 [Pseudomonas aeruginosa]|uniref:DUF6030 family protein n=1 Tax=Pseudomonas aeruginosa TaxID=287 RepID=UPI0005BC7B43|nr:DUF6030 family protein [Pseudomonas aeruginosa]EKV2963972.1 hypothetical protein [Pseudomonas aeruginosa]EKV3144201.1 hypothetical protein [Pseudomonas aeruginosa]ELQ7328949.1 hypothetical protein [Pseudomonas aeruginosa]MCU8960890.1 DUF6030 family protein [Pseudomonas aeruginosa]MCU9264665.1 DUF6030 family protein [Pseudomonas aeruginosa]
MKLYFSFLLLLSASSAFAALPSNNPDQVCAYLTREHLPTRGWHVQDDSFAGCSSNYRELGDSGTGLANNIAYYATGQGNTVSQVKIVLNLNQPQNPTRSIDALKQATRVLVQNMLNKAPPAEITSAIQHRRGDVKINLDQTSISVIRDDWPSGKGYELQVIIE